MGEITFKEGRIQDAVRVDDTCTVLQDGAFDVWGLRFVTLEDTAQMVTSGLECLESLGTGTFALTDSAVVSRRLNLL